MVQKELLIYLEYGLNNLKINKMKETLEEALERLYPENIIKLGNNTSYDAALIKRKDFTDGVNWQAKKMYSEEDMINFHKWAYQKNRIEESDKTTKELLKEWLEQFKKK